MILLYLLQILKNTLYIITFSIELIKFVFFQEQDSQQGKSLCNVDQQHPEGGSANRESDIPIQMVEEMLKKTKCLCSLIDSSMVEEVFDFLEMNRITVKPEKVQLFE